MNWLSLTLIPLGGILFRIRGGLLRLPSTTLGRLVWSIGMSIIPVSITLDWRLAILPVALFVGCVFPWWGSIDMGRDKGSWLIDAALQTARGVLWVLPAACLLVWTHGWLAGGIVAATGLLCAPLYELGWRTRSKVRGFAQGSEIGEVYFGAAIGAGLAAAIITA